MTIRSTAIRKPMPETPFPKSNPILAARPLRRRKGIDFKPGELLGSVSGALGLKKWAADNGHKLIVTSDKEGANSTLDRELPDAEVVISQPFWPAYMTAERFAKAPKLRLIITAGIGSDHTDLEAANKHGVTVAEVTYSNSISVAEHVVMMILGLVRNYIPSHDWVRKGGWNIADGVERAYDLEGMHVGTVAEAVRVYEAAVQRHLFDEGRYARLRRNQVPCAFSLERVCRWGPDHRLPQGRHRQENDRRDLAARAIGVRFGLVSQQGLSGDGKRRDHGDETLAEIGRSYNVSGWTIGRLAP
jgi:D-isomer specific 2-hydroxyacid dehydrogenase, catalytic domain